MWGTGQAEIRNGDQGPETVAGPQTSKNHH